MKDLAGNVMTWGKFSCLEFAEEKISEAVINQMENEGYDIGIEDGEEFDEAIFDEYCSEYLIEEVDDNEY